MTDDINVVSSEPKDVFIRFYGKKWVKDNNESNERLTDIIINLLTSEHNLGPKVYGMFSEGIVGEYIDGHHMSPEDQLNPAIVKEFAQKLAKFHSLNVPIARDYDWLKTSFNRWYDGAHLKTPHMDQLLKEIEANNLLKYNLKEENEWLHKCMNAMKSPIVYSHNDIFTGNILVNNRINETNDNNVVLIDFEYSRHFYRGLDLGFFVNEFGRDSNFFIREDLPLADDQWIQTFLGHYLDESVKIRGKEFAERPENSMDVLLRETKFFTLVMEIYLIFPFYAINETPDCNDRREILRRADTYYGRYIKRRNEFEKLGITPLPRY
ncbi:unnamed protein product [Medioppia subpectinata]|uniref:Ethanolamine kinase n=1 Tax=Medioppia subpectinata TaxID=1979941 RepID=A0A7R9L1G3_9ACAR|nr:unnamed protein product [Medioppia subpectinata]CAG2113723.1 unnamed protein product [Medioppia subpectinata]